MQRMRDETDHLMRVLRLLQVVSCKGKSVLALFYKELLIKRWMLNNLGPVHTAPFPYENGAKLIRFGPAFILLRCENGAFRKRE